MWRTEILLKPNSERILRTDRIYALGSCFSEHIRDKLKGQKYVVKGNEAGVLYNPVSMSSFLLRGVREQEVDAENIFLHQGLYRHRMMHSRIASADKNALIESIRITTTELHAYFTRMDWCLLTPGTAWVYTDKESGVLMGNNHKLPAEKLEKHLLSVEEVAGQFISSIDTVRKINPDCRFLFTLSPVRHLKDGMVENARSKAILLEAIHRVVQQRKSAYYFPAFEIMMDDLRDYRYYTDDMLHPSPLAIDYIWQKFRTGYMEEDPDLYARIEEVRRAMEHRFLHPEATESKEFVAACLQKVQLLKERYPTLDWEQELQHFRNLHQSISSSDSSSGLSSS